MQMLLILVMDILMLTDMLLMFLLDPAQVLTPSLRELSLTMVWDITDITMARDPLMLRPMLMLPILDMDIPMLLEPMAMLPMSHLDPAQVLTRSLRDLTLSPREPSLTMVLAITMAKDLLMLNLKLMLLILVMDILMLTDMLLMFLLVLALVLTPSPRDLTP